MDYEELVEEIKQRPITQLAALFIVTAEECVRQNVFQADGMERVLKRIIQNTKQQQNLKR